MLIYKLFPATLRIFGHWNKEEAANFIMFLWLF